MGCFVFKFNFIAHAALNLIKQLVNPRFCLIQAQQTQITLLFAARREIYVFFARTTMIIIQVCKADHATLIIIV